MNKEETRIAFHKSVFPNLIWGKSLSSEQRIIFAEWVKLFNPNMTSFIFYKNKGVLFEIVKDLGNSELCLNENIRWLFASKIESLLFYIFYYKVLEHKGENKKGDKIEGLSFYKGLSIFKNRPIPPYLSKEKKDWQDNFWTSKYLNYVIGYNFGIDIDGKDFNDSYNDCKKVVDLLTKFNVRFSVWCSGKKGFHIIIPYSEFKEIIGDFNIDKCILASKGLMLDLVKYLKLKKVDDKIYSPTRFLKCPYSLDARNNRVIYPLSNKEFYDFKNNPDKYMSIEYCLSQTDLGFRGVYPGRPSNPANFIKLIDFLDKENK